MFQTLIRLLIPLVVLLGSTLAHAQTPVPALPDTERRSAYTIAAQTGPFNVNFALYGDSTDYGNWLEVWLNGVKLTAITDYTVTSPSGSLAVLARPITNGQVTLVAAGTGTLQILGARRPRRTSQISENGPVTAHDFNLLNTDIVAMEREGWDLRSRSILVPPGEAGAVLPPAATRANNFLFFDANGNPTLSSGSGGGGGGPINTLLLTVCSTANTTLWLTGSTWGCIPTQTANTFYTGPASGGAALPTFRAMVAADIPNGILTNAKFNALTAWTNGAASSISYSAGAVGIGSALPGSAAGVSAWIHTGTNENLSIKSLSPGLSISASNDANGAFVPLTFQALTKFVFTGAPVLVGSSATPAAGTSLLVSNGWIQFDGSSSGSAKITTQAAAGTPTITIPTGTGTLAVTASAPIVLDAATGNLTCPTCTASGLNNLTITNAASHTLTILNGKTLEADNTMTFTSADGSTIALGSGGTVAYVANNLSVFAATTSAQFAGVISDETGTGAVVLAVSPALTGNPTVPTQAPGDNTTKAASTAFVTAAVSASVTGVSTFGAQTGDILVGSGLTMSAKTILLNPRKYFLADYCDTTVANNLNGTNDMAACINSTLAGLFAAMTRVGNQVTTGPRAVLEFPCGSYRINSAAIKPLSFIEVSASRGCTTLILDTAAHPLIAQSSSEQLVMSYWHGFNLVASGAGVGQSAIDLRGAQSTIWRDISVNGFTSGWALLVNPIQNAGLTQYFTDSSLGVNGNFIFNNFSQFYVNNTSVGIQLIGQGTFGGSVCGAGDVTLVTDNYFHTWTLEQVNFGVAIDKCADSNHFHQMEIFTNVNGTCLRIGNSSNNTDYLDIHQQDFEGLCSSSVANPYTKMIEINGKSWGHHIKFTTDALLPMYHNFFEVAGVPTCVIGENGATVTFAKIELPGLCDTTNIAVNPQSGGWDQTILGGSNGKLYIRAQDVLSFAGMEAVGIMTASGFQPTGACPLLGVYVCTNAANTISLSVGGIEGIRWDGGAQRLILNSNNFGAPLSSPVCYTALGFGQGLGYCANVITSGLMAAAYYSVTSTGCPALGVCSIGANILSLAANGGEVWRLVGSGGEVSQYLPNAYGTHVCYGNGGIAFNIGFCSSDERLKSPLIQVKDGMLAKVMTLEVSNFFRLSDPAQRVTVGFGAQRSIGLFPDVFYIGNDGDHLAYDSDAMLASTVKALQEAVREYRAANDNLRADFNDLRAQIIQLRRASR